MENHELLIELQDSGGATVIGVLGIQRPTTKYSVYRNRDATIDINGAANPNVVYLGQEINLDTNIFFAQSIVSGKIIFDTKYLSYKMGITIGVYDDQDNQLNADALLGVTFIINDQRYYPRMDGTIRTSIADNFSNVSLRIIADTSNNTSLQTGNYKVRIEAFGSPDGICYGADTPKFANMPFKLINAKYGLKVETEDNAKIVNKTTGNIVNGDNEIIVDLEYSSVLSNPNITVSLERRKYDEMYSRKYEKVNLQAYVEESLTAAAGEYEYEVTDNPVANDTFTINLKTKLKTGTYKLVFKLYDGDTYIGEAYEYIIIK